MIDFNNTTGKNKGNLQNTKLAEYFEKDEGTFRSLNKSNPQKYECLHLGALAQANGINYKTLEKMIEKEINQNALIKVEEFE